VSPCFQNEKLNILFRCQRFLKVALEQEENLFSNRLSYSRVQGLLLKSFRNYSVKNCYSFFFSFVLKSSKHFTRKMKGTFTEVYEGLIGKAM